MESSKLYVLLDPGHCKSTPGKCSPDKRLKEYAYAREILKGIETGLDSLNIKHWNSHPEEDFVYKTKGSCSSLDSRDLVLRTNRINQKYSELKKLGYHVVLISIHNNAAGNGWNSAKGWTVWVSKSCSSYSKKLAQSLYGEAEKRKLKGNRSVPSTKYWEQDFWILKKSNCPAILTENLFQDNKEDVEYLLNHKEEIIDLHIQGILEYIKKV